MNTMENVSPYMFYPAATGQIGYVEQNHGNYVKTEPQTQSGNESPWPLNSNLTFTTTSPTASVEPTEATFSADVNTLMNIIQSNAKREKFQAQQSHSINQNNSVGSYAFVILKFARSK